MKLNGLDLFSGIGGLALALDEWVKPVTYCEIDRYAQSVLLSRMQEGKLPTAPIWDDIKTLSGGFVPVIDILFGGFPCQDISVAGNGGGLGGERSGLYFEIERLIRETKPAFVFLENVPAIRTRGLGRVVWGLSEMGYDCRWTIVSANAIGAPHKRERWFLLAHANGKRLREKQRTKLVQSKGPSQFNDNCENESLADAESKRWQQERKFRLAESEKWLAGGGWWEAEPAVGRVADGIPNRLDRLKGLGNSVVPAQAKRAFEKLMYGI